MSSTTSKVRLTDAVEATLISGLTAVGSPAVTYPVGTVNAPSNVTDDAGKINKAHVIIEPIPGAGGESSVSDEYELVDFEYQVKCVGLTRKQAEWLEDRVRSVLTARTTAGAYVFPMSLVGGGTICERRTSLFGAVTSDAPGVYTVSSSFEMTVS